MKKNDDICYKKYEIAKRLYSEEKYHESIKSLEKAISHNCINAHISLALIYKSEIGFINLKKDYQLLEKAFSLGSIDAEIELANFDNNGINSKIGEKKSLEIYYKYLDTNLIAHTYYGVYLESRMKTFEDFALVKEVYERGLKLDEKNFHLNQSLELLTINGIDEEVENINYKIQAKHKKIKKLLIKQILLYTLALTLIMSVIVLSPALNAGLTKSIEKQKIKELERKIRSLKEKQIMISNFFLSN